MSRILKPTRRALIGGLGLAAIAAPAIVRAGSMTLLGAGKASSGGGGGGSLTFTWTDSKVGNTTPASPFSFPAASIGTASSDRFVVIGLSWEGTSSANMDLNTTSSQVSIGGVSAGFPVAYIRSGGRAHALWLVAVPLTNTGIVQVTYVTGWIDNLVLNVGTIKGSAATSVASNITSAAYPAGSVNTSVTVPANGVAVIDAFIDSATAASVTTWTGTFSSGADKDQWATVASTFTGSMTHLTTSSTTVNLTGATNLSGTWGWVGTSFQP